MTSNDRPLLYGPDGKPIRNATGALLKPAQDTDKSTAVKTDSNAKDGHTFSEEDIVSDSRPTPIAESDTAQKKNDTPAWKKILETVAVLIALGVLIINGCQLSVIKQQLIDTESSSSQTTDQIWRAIGNLNWSARSADWNQKVAQTGMEDSATNSRMALQATIDNFHQEQRAWVGPQHLELNPAPIAPEPFSATMTITNSGKTPALRVNSLFYLHPSDRMIDVFDYVKHPIEIKSEEKGSIMMLPGIPYELPAQTGGTDALGIESVKNGHKFLYFFAFISYQDVFRNIHRTRVCALYRPKMRAFGPCAENFDYAD